MDSLIRAGQPAAFLRICILVLSVALRLALGMPGTSHLARVEVNALGQDLAGNCLVCAAEQHRRLVAYYERVLSFTRLREVGDNGLRDLPDLLVWGGAGTRMNANITAVLQRWSKAFEAPS